MENNNYINEEQSVSFDYCSKLSKVYAIYGGIVLSIFFIPFAGVMAYLTYLLITNPAEISDSTAKNIFFLIFSIFMLVGTLVILWGLILKPLINKIYSKKILMSEEGIFSQVNGSFIRWDEIKKISIGLEEAKNSNSFMSYIFIQDENYKYNKWFTKSIFYSEDLITLECTYEVLDTIDKFYDDEIVNQESYQPKAEKKYVIGLMIFSIALLIFLAGIFIWILFFL